MASWNESILYYYTKELLGNDLSNEKIQSYVLNTIREGKVIPGYGHAVLRYTDPRFIH